MNSELRAVRHEDILLITLEHPSGLPRLERRILRELARQMEMLASTHELAGAVITGSAQAFCAGAELTEITSLLASETARFCARRPASDGSDRTFDETSDRRNPWILHGWRIRFGAGVSSANLQQRCGFRASRRQPRTHHRLGRHAAATAPYRPLARNGDLPDRPDDSPRTKHER